MREEELDCRWWAWMVPSASAAIVSAGAAVVSSGAINPRLIVVVAGGDGGVCRWQGRFAMCLGGGGGCVRRDGGVAGDVGIGGDAIVEIWWCSIFQLQRVTVD